jgi:hypothetical protein
MGVTAESVARQSRSEAVLTFLSSLPSCSSIPMVSADEEAVISEPFAYHEGEDNDGKSSNIVNDPSCASILNVDAKTRDALSKEFQHEVFERIDHFHREILFEFSEYDRQVVTKVISKLKESLFDESFPNDRVSSSVSCAIRDESLSSAATRRISEDPSSAESQETSNFFNMDSWKILPTNDTLLAKSHTPHHPSLTNSIPTTSSLAQSVGGHVIAAEQQQKYSLKFVAPVDLSFSTDELCCGVDQSIEQMSDNDLRIFFSKDVSFLSPFLDKSLRYSLLHSLLRCGRFHTAQALLKQGFPLDRNTSEGETAAHTMLRYCADHPMGEREFEYFLFRNIMSGLDLSSDVASYYSLSQLAIQTLDATFLEIVMTCQGPVESFSNTQCHSLFENIISLKGITKREKLVRLQTQCTRLLLGAFKDEQFRNMNPHTLLVLGSLLFPI